MKYPEEATTQQPVTYHPTGLMHTATFNGQTLTNLWAADEHRVGFCLGACQSSTSFTFVYDPTASIPAVLKEATPGDHYYYIREPDGSLIARVGPETIHYYHFDELGSTRLITNDANPAAVTDRYSYDAYGAVISHDRNTGTVDQPYQYVGQLGYYTHWMAPELGWLQLGVRFYDAETGRFERRDSARVDEISSYCYVDGGPLGSADPLGLAPSWRTCFARCIWERWVDTFFGDPVCNAAGAPVIPKRTGGFTSCASVVFRRLLPWKLPRPLPTLVMKGLCPTVRWTPHLGGAIGRAVPTIGWGLIGWVVYATRQCRQRCLHPELGDYPPLPGA